MKFVPLRDFETITEALNFSTTDLHVIGSCDLYTTKAAGSDKKLYKSIEHSLESQHESLLRLSASFSPPQIAQDTKTKRRKSSVVLPEIDLSRDSPFGPLSQISARRTFAYLIATLNATHPDYDFSNILRPSDFHRITGTAIKRSVDSTLLNMRPRRMSTMLSPTSHHPLTSQSPGTIAPPGDSAWSERMWRMIDQEMDLRHCEKYSWDPEDDPFEAESALWSQHYFFFNKERKRVCYLNFRAFSVLSHSPLSHMPTGGRGQMIPNSINNVSIGEGAGKRAQYWLGHSVDDDDVGSWGEMDDDDLVIREEDEDEQEMDMENDEEYTSTLDDVRDKLEDGFYSASYDTEISGWNTRSRSVHRGSSEGPADAMEM
ncbi:hypothetical protein AAFC00_004752 [Neodothiora populina]|uniref:Repressor of RNA polymerase III transcription MAF1 n=1 Tax=Neodothiora populina TaxID=2781224 RepID=A0ABR3P331_9PEZI